MTPSLTRAGNSIKKRDTPNDVFITPLGLSKKQIEMIDTTPDEIWYDPFRNDGSYYNQFPDGNPKEWSEILDGRDFFEFNKQVDVICSNPPYSMMTRILEKCIELEPRVISLLIGQMNYTPRRMEMLENAGYLLKKLHISRVHKWFGNSCLIQYEKSDVKDKVCLSYDCITWR
jgi:hypothetical protein